MKLETDIPAECINLSHPLANFNHPFQPNWIVKQYRLWSDGFARGRQICFYIFCNAGQILIQQDLG